MPRVVVTGGRAEFFTADDERWLLAFLESLKKWGTPELVVGCANGVDKAVRRLADAKGIQRRFFLADWESYGKRAGPIRNQRMIEYAKLQTRSCLVAFPGGPGTANCVRLANDSGLPVVFPRKHFKQEPLVA